MRISCMRQDLSFRVMRPSWKPGGDFSNFWVGLCRWDSETLSLYQNVQHFYDKRATKNNKKQYV